MSSELRKQLQALHTELSRTGPVDNESRALLVTLLTDITRVLESSERPADEDQSLTERLEEVAVQFEAEHPSLSDAVRRVVDALAKAGI